LSVENPPQIGKCLAAGERTRVGCVDLIVPVYKCAELARRCIDSILANISEIAAYSPRLIVINDSPGDPAVEELLQDIAAKHSGVVLLENPVNTGFVGAANRGLDIACTSGSDALLINADTETFPDTLRNLRDAAYSEPQVGFASPRSNNASLCSLPHPGGGPCAAERGGGLSAGSALTPRRCKPARPGRTIPARGISEAALCLRQGNTP